MHLLIGRWALAQEVGQPVDGAALVRDEQFHLRRLRSLSALAVILGNLLGQEDHAIALGETAAQAIQELFGRQRHWEVVADEPSDHPVVDAARIALDDELQHAVFDFETGSWRRWVWTKSHAESGAAPRSAEALFKPAIGLVGRDNQILLHRSGRRDLPEAALHLVERRDLGDHKASLLQARPGSHSRPMPCCWKIRLSSSGQASGRGNTPQSIAASDADTLVTPFLEA